MTVTNERSFGRAALAVLATIGLIFSTLAMVSPVFADGDDSSAECTAMAINAKAEDSGQSDDLVTLQAGAGEIVSEICIKSGDAAFGAAKHSGVTSTDGVYGEGCYTVSGLGTGTVTVTRTDSSDCHGISHVDANTEQGSEDGDPDTNIEKSASESVVTRGDEYSYTLSVTNDGDGMATNVHVWDDLDTDLDVVSVTPSQGSCDPVGLSNEISCWLGDLDAGGSAEVVIVIDTTEADCQTVHNRAFVQAENEESSSQSERIEVTIECAPTASLNILKTDEQGVPLPGAVFTVEGLEGTFTTGDDGKACITGLPQETEWLVTEIQAPAGYVIANPAWQLVEVDDDGDCNSPDAVFVNPEESEPEVGTVEIDKLFCFTDDEASTEFFVFGPLVPEKLQAQGQQELPEEGCWTEAVSFTITGGDLAEPMLVMTGDDGILEFNLPASENAYVITEDISGESAEFLVEDGEFTAVVVLNLVREEETGVVKVIKLFCEGDEASVEFIVEGADAPVPAISGCDVGDASFLLGDLEITTENGIAVHIVDVGEYTFAETDPNAVEYEGTIVVEEGEITTIIVINTFEEGEEPGGGGPGQNETPREGTQGGNPLPNTATSPFPTGSVPAALLALLMLAGLGGAGYAVRAEAKRRR